MSHHITANYPMPTALNPIKRDSTSTTGSSSTGAATGTSTTSSTSSGGTDASSIGTTFLSLLTQELQNQDPTAPMDSTAMVGQMISLNQLAELTSINQAVGGATTSVTGAMQPSSGTAPSAAAAKSTQPASMDAAPNAFPFDPSTMMPVTSSVPTASVQSAAPVPSPS